MVEINMDRVSRRFKTESGPVWALKDFDLAVEAGEVVAITGPSGSGKTTVLNLLGGLDQPTRGDIHVAGVHVSHLQEKDLAEYRRKKIGFVFQLFHLIPSLTALENVLMPAMFDPEVDEERARSLLKGVGLKGRRNHIPSRLSGGEQQRVALARALLYQPRVILADEPTGNLDRKGSRRILKLLDQYREENEATIIMVTHDPGIAARADREVHLQHGKLASTSRKHAGEEE